MKWLYISLLVVINAACQKDEASTVPALDNPSPNAAPLAAGNFQSGPYGTVTGIGKILKTTSNSYEVVLDSFSTTNGPDLYVYLSKEIIPVNFITAGKLKSVRGRQVYSLSAMLDTAQFRYICIHCKAYNHLFGWAMLQ